MLIIMTQNPFSFFVDSFGKGERTDMLEGELALVLRPVGSVALRGGYAMMDLMPEKSSGSSLDFNRGALPRHRILVLMPDQLFNRRPFR